MIRLSLFIAIALLGISDLLQAQTPERWGALAVCSNCGASGGSLAWSYGHASREAAVRDVTDRVKQRHDRVKILCVTSDRHIVVAFAKSGSIGYDHSSDENRAIDVAMRDCRRNFGPAEKCLFIDNVANRAGWAAIK